MFLSICKTKKVAESWKLTQEFFCRKCGSPAKILLKKREEEGLIMCSNKVCSNRKATYNILKFFVYRPIVKPGEN